MFRLSQIGTDPGLALKTRKGTGFYKIPPLRGVWYRPRLLHDGSVASLEEMFDPARLSSRYEPKGWNSPGVDETRRSGAPLRPVVGFRRSEGITDVPAKSLTDGRQHYRLPVPA